MSLRELVANQKDCLELHSPFIPAKWLAPS